MLATADAPAKLVQLADAEPVGVLHHHHGGVGHIDTDLDDRRAHQHIDLTRPEGGHHGVLLLAGQPAVHEPKPKSRQRAALQSRRSSSTTDGGGALLLSVMAASHRLVVIVDARRDHIDLTSGRHFLADALPGPLQPGRLLRGRRSCSVAMG